MNGGDRDPHRSGDAGLYRPRVMREYTSIGETVNLAAHLEHLTRATGGGILLTESKRRSLGDGMVIERRRELHLGGGRTCDSGLPTGRDLLNGISRGGTICEST